MGCDRYLTLIAEKTTTYNVKSNATNGLSNATNDILFQKVVCQSKTKVSSSLKFGTKKNDIWKKRLTETFQTKSLQSVKVFCVQEVNIP